MELPCILCVSCCVLRCVRSYFTVTPKTTTRIVQEEFFIAGIHSFELSVEKTGAEILTVL
jgi:Fe-S-cluster containining protein